MRTSQAIFAALTLAVAGSAFAQESNYPVPAVSTGPGLSRAEVQADLEMWQRAGLNQLPSGEGYAEIVQTAQYQKSLQRYNSLRSSPAYAEAVARHQGGRTSSN